jgi:subtilase family serine protease
MKPISRKRPAPSLELLEDRRLLNATSLLAPAGLHLLGSTSLPAAVPAPAPTIYNLFQSPSQIRTAYGVSSLPVTNQGQGMTIAIVDAYNNPDIAFDVSEFSALFGLPQMDGVGSDPTFSVSTPTGQAAPASAPVSWSVEQSLDVEWVHSIAPYANIDLVQTQDNSGDHLFAAEADGQPYASGVVYAAGLPGVSVVSNSYGGGEFAGENFYDGQFTTNPNVAMTFSTGDRGAPGEYPAYSPNVVAVGGTSLYTRTGRGAYGSEAGWAGGGGGVSLYEGTPSFQSNNGVNFGARSIPDVSMDADPNTGVSVINNQYYFGSVVDVGGTSLAAPMWAGVIALGDQLRIGGGGFALNSVAVNNAFYAAYNSPSYHTDFHDVTTGNNGFAAGPGYDLVTGIGTPIGPQLVGLLGSYGTSPGVVRNSILGNSGNGLVPGAKSSVIFGTTPVTGSQGTVFLPATTTVQAIASTSLTGQAARIVAGSSVTVSLPGASQTVQTDVNSATALPMKATSNVEGFHGTLGTTPAATDKTDAILDVGGEGVDSAAPAATPAPMGNGAALPGNVAATASDAVFADFTAQMASESRPTTPVAVLAADNLQPVDYAMMAGLALALGGSWSAFTRTEENRRVPALRN